MRIVETPVYTLAELQENDSSAFEKALDRLREVESHYMGDSIRDGLDFFSSEFMARYGIQIDLASITFNVGWGCEFASCQWEIVDNAAFLQAMANETPNKSLVRDRYLVFLEYGFDGIGWHQDRDGEWSISAIYWDWRTRDNETVVTAINEAINDANGFICDALLSSIRADYEYQNSEEYLMEMAEANEWEFTESGKLV